MKLQTYSRYWDHEDKEHLIPSIIRGVSANGVTIYKNTRKVTLDSGKEVGIIEISTAGCGCCSEELIITKEDYIKLLKERISEIQELIKNLEEF